MYYTFHRIRPKRNMLSQNSFGSWFVEQQVIIILITLFLAGIISGSLYTANEKGKLLTELLELLKNSQSARADSSFLELFFHSIISNLLFFAPVFIFGTCALGAPVVFGISFLKGLGLGVLTSFIYQNYHLQGLGYNAVILIPGAVLASSALIYACKEGFNMSISTFKNLFQLSKQKNSNNVTFKLYCMRFGVLFIFIIIASIIDGITNSFFISFFPLL